MSKENVKKFFVEIEKNEVLKKKYLDSLKECSAESEKILGTKLIELARDTDFTFTVEDLHDVRTDIIDELNQNRELSDSDLQAAAGGGKDPVFQRIAVIVASVTLFGVGCGVISLIAESERRGFCGECMTTSNC